MSHNWLCPFRRLGLGLKNLQRVLLLHLSVTKVFFFLNLQFITGSYFSSFKVFVAHWLCISFKLFLKTISTAFFLIASGFHLFLVFPFSSFPFPYFHIRKKLCCQFVRILLIFQESNKPQYMKSILWLIPANVHLFLLHFQGFLQSTPLQLAHEQNFFLLLVNFGQFQ